MSICSGAFALAAADLLDGREATTHWQYADVLRRRYPNVRVTPDVLYVDGDDVLTGAGSAAGLDMCLHLVRKDHGARIANMVARRLVVPPHREGGQAQFVEAAVTRPAEDDPVARSMAWTLAHLAEPITVARMAREACLAPRTFIRHFNRQTGTSPPRWVIGQRVLAALPLLEEGTAPIEEIGAAVGFESPATFRHHFVRAMKTSPSAYRRTFRATAVRPAFQCLTVRAEEAEPDQDGGERQQVQVHHKARHDLQLLGGQRTVRQVLIVVLDVVGRSVPVLLVHADDDVELVRHDRGRPLTGRPGVAVTAHP